MMPAWAALAVKPIAEHEFVAFFGVEGLDIADGPMVTFRQLAHPDCPLPSDQHDALQHRHGDEFVWRQANPDNDGKTAFSIGKDLHPHIRQILSGARTDLATRWLPTETATRLVSRADLYRKPVVETPGPPPGYVRKAIYIHLAPRAGQRMKTLDVTPREILLSINDFDLTLFETRKGILQARLKFTLLDRSAPLVSLEFLETAYALSHKGSLQWLAASGDCTKIGERFSLGDLLRSLCLGRPLASHSAERVFAHSFLRFDEEMSREEADALGLFAARRYNTDYEVASELEDVQRVRSFVNVGHTLCLEGAATVIAPVDGRGLPEFLRTWRTHAFQSTYLPIDTLALHEHQFLVEKTSTALLTAQQRSRTDEVRRVFLELARSSLNFRIYFRYTEISEISMHNALNRGLRKALGLDRMFGELTSDVAEVSSFLERENDRDVAEREHRRSRRFWFVTVLGGGVLAALSTTALLKQVLENRRLFAEALKDPVAAFADQNGPAFYGLLIGLIVMPIAWAVGYLKRPMRHGAVTKVEKESGNSEATNDFIVHQSLEGPRPM